MNKLLLGAVGLVTLGLALPAAAADLPARPYTKAPAIVPVALYDWSGFYIGANGGWGSSRKCWDFTTTAGTFIASEGCHDATGGVAGGQVGYRWQASSWVFGLEAQGNWADLKGSNISPISGFSDQSKIKAFGLFTGQIGYAFNTVLLYAKGGAAVTSDRFDVFTNPLAVPPNLLVATSGDQTRWGGTAGAGIEFGFAPNWSAAVEYDHLFMGNKLTNFTSVGSFLPGSLFATDRIKQDVDVVTVRVNYRWGGPVVAKY
jgi:outer membrane immunogenic protein